MSPLVNAVAFQCVWFSAVIGAGHGMAWPGVVALAVFALLQLGTSPLTRHSDLRLMLLAGAAGFALDSIFAASGLLRYAAQWPHTLLAPAWIVALWVSLALTLNHSLRLLQPRPALASVLGAVSAPMSYVGASRGFDAVAFAPPTWRTLAVVAACWAVLIPLLVLLARTQRTRMVAV